MSSLPLPPRVLVTGATGYIGGRLVPRLLEEGYRVRVMAREPSKLARRGWHDVEIVRGDAFDPDSLIAACEGVEHAYYLIHSMTTSGASFEARDREAARNFARACEQCRVARIIYLGGLGVTGSSLSSHLRSRHETGDILREGRVPVTELRAGMIVGSGSASFVIVRDLVRKLPFMICPKWVQSKCETISIREMLAFLIGVLREPRSIGEVLEVGSGEVLTYEEVMRQCAEVMGRRIWILHVPVLTPRLSAYWLNLVTSVPMNLAMPLVEGLRSDLVCTDHRLRDWIPVPRLTFREAARLALEREQLSTVESRWTDATTDLNLPLPDQSARCFVDERSVSIAASPESVFAILEGLGGDRGWYHGNWLWRLRGAMDWIIGGVGMRRGRRDPERLEVGDPVDFWRVESMDRPRLLRLRAEMKLPGIARLSFEVAPSPAGAILTMRALFWPHGLLGRMYWYAVLPLHGYVFQGMLQGIAAASVSRSGSI